jgi:succinate dehydrogenase / fumarate reductase cytochrome b subunit
MSWFTKALSGSIGKKLLMAATGLFLVVFLVEHLIGNLLLLREDPNVFNDYAKAFGENIFIRIMEPILFAGFIIHMTYAAVITVQNNKARPVGYAVSGASQNSSWFSRNMFLTGSIIFIFLVIHLKHFFVPHKLHLGAAEAETLWAESRIVFKNPAYVGLYVFSMILLGFHLVHGFASSFQTLGLRHPKYTPAIKVVGYAFAVLVPGLFAMIPLVIFFRG